MRPKIKELQTIQRQEKNEAANQKELQTIQRQEKNEAENQGITDNTIQYSAKRKMRPKIKEGITDNTAPREK